METLPKSLNARAKSPNVNLVTPSACAAFTPVTMLDFPCNTRLELPTCCLGCIYTAFSNVSSSTRSLKLSNFRAQHVLSNPVRSATDLADLSKSLP